MESQPFSHQKFRAAITLKYGIELDDTSLTILAALLADQKKRFAEQYSMLKEATDKITASSKSLQPHAQKPGWQAFWLGMGQYGLALVLCVTVFLAIYISLDSSTDQQKSCSEALQWYRSYYHLSQQGSREAMANFLKNNPRPQGE